MLIKHLDALQSEGRSGTVAQQTLQSLSVRAFDAEEKPGQTTFFLLHRTGALFEGRFRSSLIEADAYLLACSRYIKLNPVRAGMVASPAEYPWSSYRVNALGIMDPVVIPHDLYQALPSSEDERLAAYRRLFEIELDAAPLACLRDCTNGGFVLGSTKFERQIAAMLGRRTWKGAPGRPPKAGVEEQQDELPI